jgi:hypothetical protein
MTLFGQRELSFIVVNHLRKLLNLRRRAHSHLARSSTWTRRRRLIVRKNNNRRVIIADDHPLADVTARGHWVLVEVLSPADCLAVLFPAE